MELKKRMSAFEPISVIIGTGGEMLTLPMISAWTLATMLKESLLDQYHLVPGVPTPDNPNPPPVFVLNEEKENVVID